MTLENEWDRLMRIAAQLSVPLRRRFLGAVRDLSATVPLAQITRWLVNGEVDKIIQAFTSEAEKATLLRVAVQESVISAAQSATTTIGPRLLAVFNPHNPSAVEAIWQSGSRLIQQVTTDVREGIKLLVADGVQRGVNPMQTARFIRDGIGLTTNQLQAVSNFRRLLVEGDPVALQRTLRDKRFDKTVAAAIEGKTKLSQKQIDTMVEAYYRRFVDYRAKAIARTESINALSQGNRLAWQQVFEAGKVQESEVRRFWHTAHDERLCLICMAIPDLNPNGVLFRELFQTPKGPLWGPTVHPHCRCVVFIKQV